ncbi:unnamed protein product [Nezara viridula]|uniref:MARVEL domain-containing protein n=1 Tax=Nezara viridula TaxID=85310 RepID=A0A9P0EB33_NEZVI|nr:unnamed protein product [Nezara viridula]
MMTEQGFPVNHTTTTTVTTSNTTVQTDIRYDPLYIRSVPGILKCVEIVLNLLVFLSASFSKFSHVAHMSFTSLICGFGFWVTGILLGCYAFHVVEKFYRIPWLKFELIYTGIWAFFLMIGSTFCAAYMGSGAVFGVVSFFGYINMIAYAYDCFLKFKSIQNGEIAQGERIKTTSTVTSPSAY